MAVNQNLINTGLTVGKGLFDFFGGKAANDANQELAAQNIAAQAANQEKGLAALTGGTAFANTIRNADGGFNTTQLGDRIAADVRNKTVEGDVGRQNFRNNASDNFAFNLPDINAARGTVQSDINTTQRNFDDQANKVIEAQRRNFGGVNNSGETPATLDKLFQLSQNYNFGKETQALDLLGKSNRVDLDNLDALNRTFAPQAPAPGFTGANTGAQAANVIAQSPPPAPAIDLGSAIAPTAISSTLQNLLAQQQTQQNNKQFLAALAANRGLGNQGN